MHKRKFIFIISFRVVPSTKCLLLYQKYLKTKQVKQLFICISNENVTIKCWYILQQIKYFKGKKLLNLSVHLIWFIIHLFSSAVSIFYWFQIENEKVIFGPFYWCFPYTGHCIYSSKIFNFLNFKQIDFKVPILQAIKQSQM